VKSLKLERGKVHSNGNKETYMFHSLEYIDYKLRGVGGQNWSLPSQEEETTWPQGGLIQMAGDGPTHNERKRITAQEQMFLFAFPKEHPLLDLSTHFLFLFCKASMSQTRTPKLLSSC